MPLQLGRDRAFDPTNRAFSNDSPKAEVFLFFVFGEVVFWFFLFLFLFLFLFRVIARSIQQIARGAFVRVFFLCGGG